MPIPRWWEAFHAGRMRRSFIRHRAMYRIKARVHVAFTSLTGALEAGELIVILLPFRSWPGGSLRRGFQAEPIS
jgi:hypothetical protein